MIRLLLYSFVNVLLFSLVSYSQPIQSVKIDFERTYKVGGTQEITKGTIYYQAPEKLTADIHYPVNQWLIYNEESLIIYYPQEKRAFEVVNQISQQLGFFQVFISHTKEDIGLTEIGYTLNHQSINGDTLSTYWSPSRKLKKIYGEFILVHAADKIVYAESRKQDQSILSRTIFEDHVRYGSYYFPLKIHITSYTENDTSLEDISFSDPQFNLKLPSEFIDFKLPQDVKMETIKW